MNDKPSVMKTVIIEDEKAAVRNLTSLLNEVKPEAEIIAILDSINSTIEWFDIHPMPELVFMDIHLADGSIISASPAPLSSPRLTTNMPCVPSK